MAGEKKLKDYSAKELFVQAHEKQEKDLETQLQSVFDVQIHALHHRNVELNWSLHLLVHIDGTIENANSFDGYGMAKTARVLGGYMYMDGEKPIPLINNFIVQTMRGAQINTITVTKRKTFIPHEHECDSYHPGAQ